MDINEIINRKFNTTRGYMYFVDRIIEKYPSFKINEENLKTLSIVEMSNEYFNQTGFVGEYVAKRNEIKILVKSPVAIYELTDDEIIETFLHELIHALTTYIREEIDQILEGINLRRLSDSVSSFFLGLNEGITQYIVNDLLEIKSDAYPYETNLVEKLELIIGKDNLLKYYSNNDISSLENSIKNIDPLFNFQKLIFDIYCMHLIVSLQNYEYKDVETYIRGTNIEQLLLNLYLSTNREFDDEYFSLCMNSEKIAKIVNPEKLRDYLGFKNLNIEEIGFTNIDDVFSEAKEKLKKKESIKKESVIMNDEIVVNKNGDLGQSLIEKGQNQAKEMVERIKKGQVIEDITYDNGERLVVTITSPINAEIPMYGYQVFEPGAEEAHYYVEGMYLISDLYTNTDSNGVTLRYSGAKSLVQRNMLGLFNELILDKGFEAFYTSIKTAKDQDIQVQQRMAGAYESDPVTLLSYNFNTRKVNLVGHIECFEESKDGKIVKVMRCGLDRVDNGELNYDSGYKFALEAEQLTDIMNDRGSFRADTVESLNKKYNEAIINAQSMLKPVYQNLGIPLIEGVEFDNALFYQAHQASLIGGPDAESKKKLN